MLIRERKIIASYDLVNKQKHCESHHAKK